MTKRIKKKKTCYVGVNMPAELFKELKFQASMAGRSRSSEVVISLAKHFGVKLEG
jgi:hypothetical protein